MKKLSMVLALVCAVALPSWGQQQTESLVGSGYWAFWLRPEAKLTTIDGNGTGMAGGQLGVSLNRSLYVGLGYYGLLGSVDIGSDVAGGEIGNFDLWYTGGTVAYTFNAKSLVHGSVGVLLGGGNVSADMNAGGSESSGLFVAEPEVNLLINVSPGLELGFGASYRIVTGADEAPFSNSDLSGPAGSIFIRWTEDR